MGALAKHLAECAATGLSVEQAEDVAGDVLEGQALAQAGFDVRAQGAQQLTARTQRRGRLRVR